MGIFKKLSDWWLPDNTQDVRADDLIDSWADEPQDKKACGHNNMNDCNAAGCPGSAVTDG